MPKAPRVRVLAVTPLSAGSVLATFSVAVGETVYHGVRLTRHPDGTLSVIPPQIKWIDPETGCVRYWSLIKWPKPIRRAIVVALSASLEEQAALEVAA